MNRFALIAAVNDKLTLESTLLSSPDIGRIDHVIIEEGHKSAAHAYNTGIDKCNTPTIIFAHQDVYFPDGWLDVIESTITTLEKNDIHWGVLGVFGISKEQRPVGHVYSTGLSRVLGARFCNPILASTLDEMVLIVKRLPGLRFDEELPGFHFYGTDICLQAQTTGMSCFVIPAFCIHNSNGVAILPVDFWKAYFYIRRKWHIHLPVTTTCVKVTKGFGPLYRYAIRAVVGKLAGRHVIGHRVENPAALYNALCSKRAL
jgi:hypothetical protein